MVNIIVKPNPEKKVDEKSIRVLNPITRKFISENGEKVLQTSYWVRLLSNKSVLKIDKIEENKNPNNSKEVEERTLNEEEVELLTKIVDNLPEEEEQKFLSIALEVENLNKNQKEILFPFIKNEAERLSIKYAINIGFDTLKERVLEVKKEEEAEIKKEAEELGIDIFDKLSFEELKKIIEDTKQLAEEK